MLRGEVWQEAVPGGTSPGRRQGWRVTRQGQSVKSRVGVGRHRPPATGFYFRRQEPLTSFVYLFFL